MLTSAFVIKYAEIGIKGKNRYVFEDALVRRIKESLANVDGDFQVYKEQGRVFITVDGDYDYDEAINRLTKVFGITGICPAVITEDEGFDRLAEQIIDYIDKEYDDKNFTFKVKARRARKD